MMRRLQSKLLFAFALCTAVSAVAQPQETFTLREGLYYACKVSLRNEATAAIPLEVSYFVYGDKPGSQVNFRDPNKLTAGVMGWAPKGHFALSRRTTEGRLLIWVGAPDESSVPQVNATVELTPVAGYADRAEIALERFQGSGRMATAESYSGHCEMLSGREAWDRFQGVPKK